MPTPDQQERDGWQLIKTAPRDGTTIFGYAYREGHRGMVHFNKRGEWEMVDGLTNLPNGITFQPTHWILLPRSPLNPPHQEEGQ